MVNRGMPPDADIERVATILAARGFQLNRGQTAVLSEYRRLLYLASGRTNLISPGDREEIALRHILPSLYMGTLVRLVPNRIVLDFGSGAGIPGIPLKILYPSSHLTLVESRRKRANFLRDTVRRLGFSGVEVKNHRIEELYVSMAGTVDVVVTRAASDLERLWSAVGPVLKDHGVVITTLDLQRGFHRGIGVLMRQKNQAHGQTHWFAMVR